MPPSSPRLLVRNGPPTHVSIRTVLEWENVLMMEGGLEAIPEGKRNFLNRALYRISRVMPGPFRLFERSFYTERELYFAVLMGVEHVRKAFPYFFRKARRKGVYVFDCWPSKYDRMAEEVERYGIDPLFLSSAEACKGMRERLPEHPRILHVPEGIDPSPYRLRPYEEKDIDVLQFGRKHETYHQALLEGKEDLHYLYEEQKGALVFPDLDAFVEGLSRSRISICFPASMTHPDRAQGVSTLTQRYLQSMASKCLVVGSMPEDARSILPEDAVIEADLDRPLEQIREILARFEQYIPLIERNYELVLKEHTWKARAAHVLPYLEP